jgi:hypothetical protein
VPKLKPAIYQVNEPGGFTRLICIVVPTFEDGVRTEGLLRARFGRHSHVAFLGRFDCLEMAPEISGFLEIETELQELRGDLEASTIGAKISAQETHA